MKHYVQSCGCLPLLLLRRSLTTNPHAVLLGVPRVIVGFRTRQGQLTALQPFKTLEIPRLYDAHTSAPPCSGSPALTPLGAPPSVRGKPHAWDPLACLASARALLSFLFTQLTAAPATRAFQARFAAATAIGDDRALAQWPVYRLEFSPTGSEPGISVRELGEDEVRRDVWGAKREERRVGFLLERWVESVLRRRLGR